MLACRKELLLRNYPQACTFTPDMCGCSFLRNSSGPRGPELVMLV